MKKILSIVTVCYNSEKTIEKCIKSIVSQLDNDVEYIIIDGGSKDKTLDIINKYQDNIKYISEPDNGIYDAMNKGLNMCNGKYVLYMNSDDYLIENSLEKIKKILYEDNYDIIYGDALYLLNKNNTIYYRNVKSGNDLTKLNIRNVICHQSAFTRVSAIKKVGMFNDKYRIASDWDLWVKLRNANYKFLHINENIACFSVTGLSSLNFSFKEHKKIRKENKLYKVFDYYIIYDIKDFLLTKGKIIAEKYLKFDWDKIRIKKGIYRKFK